MFSSHLYWQSQGGASDPSDPQMQATQSLKKPRNFYHDRLIELQMFRQPYYGSNILKLTKILISIYAMIGCYHFN